MANDKNKNRLVNLRKYLQSDSDVEIAKEMIADGLDDKSILEAFGYPDEDVRSIQPDEHSFGTSVPTDEEDAATLAAQKGGNPQPEQPGESKGENVSGESSDEQEDPLVHVVGLINHLIGSKKKPK